MNEQQFNIALILNTNQAYNRKIVSGVTRFMRQVENWNIHMEIDPKFKIPDLKEWKGHGIIADLGDLEIYHAVKELDVPVVGVGDGHHIYPEVNRIPYVFSDNHKVAELAFEHLYYKGFKNLAFCGMPEEESHGWAKERLNCFVNLCNEYSLSYSVFPDEKPVSSHWNGLVDDVKSWLMQLEKPVGIMAANDMMAHKILDACIRANISVPNEVAVVGVDNDEMICSLSTPPLSSVMQGTDLLGYHAAGILDKMIRKENFDKEVIVPPLGLSVRESSDRLVVKDDVLANALLYIKNKACMGIRVDHVADHCNVSRSTLDNKFKIKLGCSVHYEITKLQLKKVKDLLIQDAMSIKQISRQAGFSSCQYMSIKFKKETGLSPAQFRKRHSKQLVSS